MSGARRLVVTGATGFVGRHLIGRARRRDWEVVGIGRERSAGVERAGARSVAAPLEPDALTAHFEGATAVVHLANIGAERGGARYDEVNVGGTRAVIAAAERAGVARIVYLSGLGVARYGQSRRVTNRYFLSKLQAELALYASGLDVAVLRPSYVLGPGGELIAELRDELRRGRVEVIAGGAARMQPIAVGDAADAILAAAARAVAWPLAFDLVGPEPVSYRGLVERVAGRLQPPPDWSASSISEDEADRAAAASGYRGMGPEALDCLLCDEVGDPAPLVTLMGRALTPLDEVLGEVLEAA